MEGLAAYALKASGARPGDVMILGSVSGRTLSVVDLAYEAKKWGLKTIVITSMSYATSVDSPHSSGLKLYELGDVVLDNCAPAAEALMEVEGLEPGSVRHRFVGGLHYVERYHGGCRRIDEKGKVRAF